MLILPAAAQAPPSPPPDPSATYRLSPEQERKAIEYACARHRTYFASEAWGALVLAGIAAAGIGSRLRDGAERVSRRPIVQAYVFVPALLLVVDGASLPIDAWYHHLAVKYEQSIQGWGSWFWDWTKGELIGCAFAGVLVWILYAVMRRSPRRWWFWGWVAALPILVFLMFIQPVLIEPLFYHFEPLAARNAALVGAIEKVTARGGLEIPRDRMFEMRASEKLRTLNAYVAGIGASKRVVVWDTTIRKMTTGETLFVFGHEMGHYVLGHIWIGTAAAAAGLLIGLWVAYHAAGWIVGRRGAQWRIRSVEDWASLPVLMLVFAVLSFLSDPIANGFSRVLEHNADIYGLEVIHGIVPDSSRVAARAFQTLGEVGLADPDPSPLVEFWLYDHPAVRDRVRFAATYNPWSEGRQPKYVR